MKVVLNPFTGEFQLIGDDGFTDEQVITASGTMSLPQMFGVQLNNSGASSGQMNDVTLKLLPAAKGMNFTFICGKTVAGKNFHFDPDDTDQFYPDGGAGLGNGKYLGFAEATKGYALQFKSFWDDANSKYNWWVGQISGPTVTET